MSTHTALYVQSSDIDTLATAAREHLAASFPDAEITIEDSPRFPPIYFGQFRSDRRPTTFAIAGDPNGWCKAHFNCFSPLDALASSLSARVTARVIVLNVQTVSSCYYVGVYDRGLLCRAFDYQDGEWVLNEGLPFEFESEVMEQDIRESNVVCFCENLGLPPNSLTPRAEV